MIDNRTTAKHLIALLGAELLGKTFTETLSLEEIKEIYSLSLFSFHDCFSLRSICASLDAMKRHT